MPEARPRRGDPIVPPSLPLFADEHARGRSCRCEWKTEYIRWCADNLEANRRIFSTRNRGLGTRSKRRADQAPMAREATGIRTGNDRALRRAILDDKAIGKTLAGLDKPPASRILAKVDLDASLLRLETPAPRPLLGAGDCTWSGRGECGRPPDGRRRTHARRNVSAPPALRALESRPDLDSPAG